MGQVPYELIGTSGTSSWNQCWNQSEFQIPQFFVLKKAIVGI